MRYLKIIYYGECINCECIGGEMKAGDMSFHNGLLIHRAGPNFTNIKEEK